MKKILFPNQIKKAASLKTIIFSTAALFIFTIPSASGQCCATLSFTKTCHGKNTGTATVIPCTPGNYSYLWDDASAQTSPTAVGLAAGTYHVLITANNIACQPLSVTVADSSCTPFSVPNIMTPNGDGINDLFVINGLESGTKLTVFNRWGEVVYSNNNYSNDWDASDLTDGVYFYTLGMPATEAAKGKNDPSRGFIQIISGK